MNKELLEKWREYCGARGISKKRNAKEWSREHKAFRVKYDEEYGRWYKEYNKQRHAKRRIEDAEKTRERCRRYYWERGGKEKNLIAKKRRRAANPEKFREYQRNYYRENASSIKAAVRAYKQHRNPARGVKRAIEDYLAGRCEFDALALKLGTSLREIDAWIDRLDQARQIKG